MKPVKDKVPITIVAVREGKETVVDLGSWKTLLHFVEKGSWHETNKYGERSWEQTIEIYLRYSQLERCCAVFKTNKELNETVIEAMSLKKARGWLQKQNFEGLDDEIGKFDAFAIQIVTQEKQKLFDTADLKLVAEMLTPQGLKLFRFLQTKKYASKFSELRQIEGIWKVSQPTDTSIEKALKRLRESLYLSVFTIEIKEKSVKLVDVRNEKT